MDPDKSVDKYLKLRIASIFVILVGSLFGALVPVLLARWRGMRVPRVAFFVAKYFGSGVILGTAWMHLMGPAADELRDPSLEPRLGQYDWAMAIALMTIMTMFLIELMAAHFDRARADAVAAPGSAARNAKVRPRSHSTSRSQPATPGALENGTGPGPGGDAAGEEAQSLPSRGLLRSYTDSIPGLPGDISYPPGGEDHLGHQREHVNAEDDSHAILGVQMTSIFILEFGVIFHSVFIGLTLALTADSGFPVLFVVITFHQLFEGLGLGTRLAVLPRPPGRAGAGWLPYLLGAMYAVTTPVAIAAGLGVRQTLEPGSPTALLVNGIFDAVSGGILIYTGLVELLAHEFMFSSELRNAPMRVQLFAYACVCAGTAVMAVLAKWV